MYSDNHWDKAEAGKVTPSPSPLPDFLFEDHGSIWLVAANNPDALIHLQEHTDSEAQWWGQALVVEPRYVGELALRLREKGYKVEGGRF